MIVANFEIALIIITELMNASKMPSVSICLIFIYVTKFKCFHS